MKPKLLLGLALLLSGIGYPVPADERLKRDQQELCALLAKASPGGSHTNLPTASRHDEDFSPYLTQPENERLVKLLRDPETASIVTREQVLAAVKQRQLDDSLPGFQYNALLDLVNRRWPHDPVVIAFYREALATRGDAAIFELWSPQPGVWDDSLLEPVVNWMEKTSSWITMDIALSGLEQHRAVWAEDASIPPRLNKALLTMFPSLTNTSLSGPQPGEQMWCNAVNMLAKTHAAAVIPVLRPFLKDKAVAGDGSYWVMADSPPLRACDKAAMAIGRLLGNEDFSEEPWAMAGAMFRKVPETHPKWDEWDKKIAELQKGLDALESASNFIRTNDIDTGDHVMGAPEAVQRISNAGAPAWRVSWRHKTPPGAAAIKGGQLVIIIYDSGRIEKGTGE